MNIPKIAFVSVFILSLTAFAGCQQPQTAEEDTRSPSVISDPASSPTSDEESDTDPDEEQPPADEETAENGILPLDLPSGEPTAPPEQEDTGLTPSDFATSRKALEARDPSMCESIEHEGLKQTCIKDINEAPPKGEDPFVIELPEL